MTFPTRLRSVWEIFSIAICALLTGLFMFLAFIPHQTVVDLGWHIAQGRWMVQHLWPYDQDKFNYPNLNHPVVDEYPVFQVVLYLFSIFGLMGPPALASLGYGALIYLNLRPPCFTKYLPRPIALYGCLVALAGLMIGIELRPHLITYLGITGFGLILMANHRVKRLVTLWPLFLLQVIWVNGHSGFVIGPAMVGLFGFEMIIYALLRAWKGGRRNDRTELWQVIRVWSLAIVLDIAACLVNPYGFQRLYLPFYQHDMVSLRAFVSEMQPLQEPFLGLYQELILICEVILGFFVIRSRRACLAWIVLACLFYEEALSVQKYWPVFALFLPLIGLSSTAFKEPSTEKTESGPIERGVEGVLSCSMIAGLIGAWWLVLNPSVSFSPLAAWRDFNAGHTLLPVESIQWMRAHQLEGRIFHRAEYGGLLQELGYTGGEVYGDTGFGKYSPEMIHELELVGDRVSYAKLALAWYHPQIVLCGNYSHLWPGFLRSAGWRLVHYTPSGSVWLQPGFRPDLVTVTSDEVVSIFRKDLANHGRGSDLPAYARNLIALQALGLEDEAFAQVQALPAALHEQGFYWDLAAIMCGMDPPLSSEHRNAFVQEAQDQRDAGPNQRDVGSNQRDVGSNNQRDAGPNQRDVGSNNQRDVGSNNQRDVGSNNQRDAGPNQRDAGPNQRDVGSNNQRDVGSNNQRDVGSDNQRDVGSNNQRGVGSDKKPVLNEMTRSFLVQASLTEGKPDDARVLAKDLKMPMGPIAEFLVEDAIAKGDWGIASRLIARTELFDLRSGRYYQLKAECEAQAGFMKQAGEDWNLAIYSWPDDPQIRTLAKAFALRMNDTSLIQKLDDSLRFYAE